MKRIEESKIRIVVSLLILALPVGSASAQGQPQDDLSFDELPALPLPPGITPQSRCGTTEELQDVELYDGKLEVSKEYVKTHQPTTFQLQWESAATIREQLPEHAIGNVADIRWCSATLISEKTALTAGHCFDVQDGRRGWITPFTLDDAGGRKFAPPHKLAPLQKANFLYQVNGDNRQERQPIVFPVERLVEHRGGNLDYAVIELGPGPDGKLPGALFPAAEVLTRLPIVRELLGVIQHPQGWPKKVEAGKLLRVNGSWALYDDVDTYSGSSGSGVRDADGALVAVHTNGGCTRTGGANRGVTTAAIARVSNEF